MQKYYTFKEVCELIGVTKRTLYNWEKQEIIKVTRINNKPRIAESELKKLVEGE